MIIEAIKTDKIDSNNKGIMRFLNDNIPALNDKSIVVITSKIISIFEGRVVKADSARKEELIMAESDYYLPKKLSKYGFTLTIKDSLIVPSAGIDESNSFGNYVLWPENPFKSAKVIWKYLRKKNKLKYLGVIITDSRTTPLRWGTTGVAIAFCGIAPLRNYIGKPDIFGKKMRVTKSNIVDGLAAAAVVQMGEGNEQTPICIIKDAPFVQFKLKSTNQKELENFNVSREDDLYSPIISSVAWRKGKA